MTIKNEKTGQPTQETRTARPTQDEIQAAYQAHTLAQMLYGQMAMTHPWLNPAPPVAGTPQMYQGLHGYHAFQGVSPMASWAVPYQGYPFAWGVPRHHWIW